MSVYDKNTKYYNGENKKVVGKMKNEHAINIISEYVGLKSKMYSLLLNNNKCKNVGKGIKKCVL